MAKIWEERRNDGFRSAMIGPWLVWFREIPRKPWLEIEIQFDSEEQLLEFKQEYFREIGVAGEEANPGK